MGVHRGLHAMTRARKRHGGARPGAGRKPLLGVRRSVQINTWATPDEAAAINATVEASGATDRSTWVRDVLLAAAGYDPLPSTQDPGDGPID